MTRVCVHCGATVDAEKYYCTNCRAYYGDLYKYITPDEETRLREEYDEWKRTRKSFGDEGGGCEIIFFLLFIAAILAGAYAIVSETSFWAAFVVVYFILFGIAFLPRMIKESNYKRKIAEYERRMNIARNEYNKGKGKKKDSD